MCIRKCKILTSWSDYVTRPRNENHMQSKLSMSKRNGLNWMNHHLTIIAWWNFFWYAEGQNFDRYFLYGDVEDLAFFGFTLFRNKTNNFTSVLFFSVINRDGSETFFFACSRSRVLRDKKFFAWVLLLFGSGKFCSGQLWVGPIFLGHPWVQKRCRPGLSARIAPWARLGLWLTHP